MDKQREQEERRNAKVAERERRERARMELKSDKAKMRLDKLDSKTRAKLVERCVLVTGRLPRLPTIGHSP
jgi:hypothetical protein